MSSFTKHKPGTIMLPMPPRDDSGVARPEQIIQVARDLCQARAAAMPGTFAVLFTDESAAVHGVTRSAIRDALPGGIRLDALDMVALVRQGRLLETVHGATGEVRYWPRGMADEILLMAECKTPSIASPAQADAQRVRRALQNLVDLLTAATDCAPSAPGFARNVGLAMQSLDEARAVLANTPI